MLENINSPKDLKALGKENYPRLASEIRNVIIDSVSKNGGHLASNLGIVELTIALHIVFESPTDKLIFDVGHQAYVHKILTGRTSGFEHLRKKDGLSGFPRVSESDHDHFSTGHSSTAISSALGLARARDIQHEDYSVVAIVGDGALTGGMCYEALNDAGNSKTSMIVIINDNEMSISQNVGALSVHLTKLRQSYVYRGTKKAVRHSILRLPRFISQPVIHFFERSKNAFKQLFVQGGQFFEALGFEYMGKVDGHDIDQLIDVLSKAKLAGVPTIVHVATQKGKGYVPAENRPEKFHGIAPFFIDTGAIVNAGSKSSGDVVSSVLCEMAKNNPKITAITAAMQSGTGLSGFARRFPERFFDVGIAEQHAVTFAAGLAKGGMKPYFVVYSTFLQRGYDQILHDVCLQNLPVKLLLDRCGFVGEDGATHHGLYDIAYLSMMPNMTIIAPKDKNELRSALEFSQNFNSPCAIRYPKSMAELPMDKIPIAKFELGKWEILKQGKSYIISYGRMLETALAVSELLPSVGVINARFIKPMDTQMLDSLNAPLIILEEASLIGSLGSMVTSHFSANGKSSIMQIGVPDEFFSHGKVEELLLECKLDVSSVTERIAKWLEEIHDRG